MGKKINELTKEEQKIYHRKSLEARKRNRITAAMFSVLLGKELSGEPPVYFRKKYAHLYRSPAEKLTMKELIIRAWIDAGMEGNMMAITKLIETDNIGKEGVATSKSAFEAGLEAIKNIFGDHSGGI
jgi:hypothetical protein